MRKTETKKITSIGGSALIEGIMMRGPKKNTVAVRTKDGIYTEDVNIKFLTESSKFWKLPFIRGVSGMIDSMRLSYKSLMISADKAMEAAEEEDKKEKAESEEPADTAENTEVKAEEKEEPKKEEKEEKGVMMKVLMIISSLIGVALAVLLFFFLPTWIFGLLGMAFPALNGGDEGIAFWQSVIEGLLKIAIFISYILIVSMTPDMKRVFQYHGAEHKTIFCYERELELTPENVMKQSRFHPRCGTSFILLMLLVGIIIGLFIPKGLFLRPLIKILLLPITMGIGYELIKFCGKHDNKLTRIIAAPGLWAQRVTTKEPDEKMCEVAIKAIESVIPEDGSDIVKNGCC